MSQIAEFIERQSRDSSTFNNTYQTLGDALSSPGVLIKIVNDSTQDIDVSTNGVTDHDFVPANGFTLYDLRTNKGSEFQFAFPKNTQFFVKGAAAGTGNVYLVVIKERFI